MMLNKAIRKAPTFDSGLPMYMVISETMNTHDISAHAKEKLNGHYKKIMENWMGYLSSPDSRDVLSDTEGGWLTQEAKKRLTSQYRGRSFEQVFVCSPDEPHHGYTSYNDFFTRRFREIDVDRPLEDIDNLSLISAPCESSSSTGRFVRHNVQADDELIIKGEPYTLYRLLCGHESVPSFVGGSVFHTSMDKIDYHRWHAPVSGTIERIISVPGTYFTEKPGIMNASSSLQSPVNFSGNAARLIIFIRADNPTIGLVCFIASGMTEISSCEATVHEGQKVKRGDELGTFHFGGSTHSLIFGKGDEIQMSFIDSSITSRINSTIATVIPSS
jgi:phosphatidylserine decarboxylase